VWSAGPNAPEASKTADGDVGGNAILLTSRGVPIPAAPVGALIAKRNSIGMWQLIGSSATSTVSSGESLTFMMNDATDSGYTDLNTGMLSVAYQCQ
jgi:hypothetical protein